VSGELDVFSARTPCADEFSECYVRRYIYINTMHCNILQHTATHCNTLQHTATRCNILQHTELLLHDRLVQMTFLILMSAGIYVSTQCTATRCNALQHTATRRNTLQHSALATTRSPRANDLLSESYVPRYICINTMHGNTLQHTATSATHCNILQHTATRCNTLQHTELLLHDRLVQMTFLILMSAGIYVFNNALQHIATNCNTLQDTARHCNTLLDTIKHCIKLQHTARYCNTLQHTATHCNTL